MIVEGIGKAGEKIWEGIKGIGKKVVEKLSKNLFGERDKEDRERYPTQQEAVMPTPIKIGKKEEEEGGEGEEKDRNKRKGRGKGRRGDRERLKEEYRKMGLSEEVIYEGDTGIVGEGIEIMSNTTTNKNERIEIKGDTTDRGGKGKRKGKGNRYSDGNQRNNETEEGGKRIGDKMCYPTAVAVALSRLGIENPGDDMQYEDYIQTLFDTDTNLSGMYAGNVPPRGNPYAEEAMAERYFGVSADVEPTGLRSHPELTNISQISNFYNTTIKSNINNGKQVILSTDLTGSGHVVNLNRVTNTGIYFQDPYGVPTFGTNGVSYHRNRINWNYTAGTNIFASWSNIQNYRIGVGKYYMTIGTNRR